MSSLLFIFSNVSVAQYTLKTTIKTRITQKLAVIIYKSILKYPERFWYFLEVISMAGNITPNEFLIYKAMDLLETSRPFTEKVSIHGY